MNFKNELSLEFTIGLVLVILSAAISILVAYTGPYFYIRAYDSSEDWLYMNQYDTGNVDEARAVLVFAVQANQGPAFDFLGAFSRRRIVSELQLDIEIGDCLFPQTANRFVKGEANEGQLDRSDATPFTPIVIEEGQIQTRIVEFEAKQFSRSVAGKECKHNQLKGPPWTDLITLMKQQHAIDGQLGKEDRVGLTFRLTTTYANGEVQSQSCTKGLNKRLVAFLMNGEYEGTSPDGPITPGRRIFSLSCAWKAD